MTERRIKLKRYGIKEVNFTHIHGFRIRIEVAEAIGMDPNVFIYNRHPPDPFTGEVFDEFLTVTSFPDLAEYPANAPNLALGLPYFRLSYLELDVRSLSACEQVWKIVKQQVCFLKGALDKADDLVLMEEVICGGTGDLPISDTVDVSQSTPTSESSS